MTCCRLESERLLLRPPRAGDIAAMVSLADDYDIAKNTSMMPHPYTMADAEDFLTKTDADRAAGTDFIFAITRKSDGVFMGNCGLHLRESAFEIGYWLGKPYWGRGYATESAKRMIVFAFHDMKAEKVWAGWFYDNPASGRVLQKLGFRPSGGDERDSKARGTRVACNLVTLTRAEFGRKKAA